MNGNTEALPASFSLFSIGKPGALPALACEIKSCRMKKHKTWMAIAGAVALFALSYSVEAQTARNPLPRIINVSGRSHISPSLSGDGKHMVFVSNYSTSGKMVLKYAQQTSPDVWTEPVEIAAINLPGKDFIGGHWLSYDGSLLFFTSSRGPSMGGYDIFFSERKGSYWTPPQNVGKPVNSEAHDGHPSLSPDGRFLYFMRCEKMDNEKQGGCELYVSEKISDTRWGEPQKLPYPVNTGDESTPRIMPDGETLVFASKRPGGKGGYDLYQSKLTNGQWSAPKPCDYLNSDDDDLYVSVPAHGELVFYSALFRDRHTIIKAKIPEELKPSKVAMIQGRIQETNTGKPLDGVAQVYDARTGKMDQFVKTKPDGSFFVMIKGGEVYDFSVSARENHHVYFSKIYDLEGLEKSVIEDLDLKLKPCKTGTAFVADDILFEPFSAIVAKESEVALLRLSKLLRDNRGAGLQIAAYLPEVRMDTVPDADLTEIIVDTVYLPVDTMHVADTAYMETGSAGFFFDQDSLTEFEPCADSAQVRPLFTLRYTYHNDRTEKQAAAVRNRLIELGVPERLVKTAEFRNLESMLDASERQKLRPGSVVILLDQAY